MYQFGRFADSMQYEIICSQKRSVQIGALSGLRSVFNQQWLGDLQQCDLESVKARDDLSGLMVIF